MAVIEVNVMGKAHTAAAREIRKQGTKHGSMEQHLPAWASPGIAEQPGWKRLGTGNARGQGWEQGQRCPLAAPAPTGAPWGWFHAGVPSLCRVVSHVARAEEELVVWGQSDEMHLLATGTGGLGATEPGASGHSLNGGTWGLK